MKKVISLSMALILAGILASAQNSLNGKYEKLNHQNPDFEHFNFS